MCIRDRRRTIDFLTKTTSELTHNLEKAQGSADKKSEKYKKQTVEYKEMLAAKIKEHEKKVDQLEKKIVSIHQEYADQIRAYEESLDKNSAQILDLKTQVEDLKEMAKGNNVAKRCLEIEAKLQEVQQEKQKILKEMYKLRDQLSEKEDILLEKNNEIKIYKNNIDGLTQQIESLSAMKDAAGGGTAHNKDENENALRKLFNSKRKSAVQDQGVFFMDKNVIKPIRGGGGKKEVFEKNNFILVGGNPLKTSSKIPSISAASIRESLEGIFISPRGKEKERERDQHNNNTKGGEEEKRGKSRTVMRNGAFTKLFRDSDDESMGVSAHLDEEMNNALETKFAAVGMAAVARSKQSGESKSNNSTAAKPTGPDGKKDANTTIKNLFSSVKKLFQSPSHDVFIILTCSNFIPVSVDFFLLLFSLFRPN
eukprot:TRINITY_DN9881_c0_g1_i4.p1 TRINITY_DN9881_c0_g1~~TRINITY_DN9881_c0_g1_i4.p1  ORF type:complete len:444 (-),score=175.28 TRINITY_DN9881_c0_g1_i4:88-1359(-)